MTNDTITKTVFFTAKREVVWSYLIDKDKLGTWFHPARADLEVGADYVLGEAAVDGSAQGVIWGTVLEFEPCAKLKYTFIIPPLKGCATIVTWTLEEFEGGTRLTMCQEGVGALDEGALELLTHLDFGWDGHLDRLRTGVKELAPV